MIKKYLVGGAVRDQIMGIPTSDFDYVVVGSTPDEMIKLGYKPIGKDFPVFLHPETHEEYALARTEKKISKGYHGFEFYASPDITLEEDLGRRDITINAIAQDDSGQFIDPYCGIDDIKNKIIRHVSEAFTEDPLRVIRVARFKAKFPDFIIHQSTFPLLEKIVMNNEIQTLSAERIVEEIRKALPNSNIITMLEVLEECRALNLIFPNSNFVEIRQDASEFFGSPKLSELHLDDQVILLLLILYSFKQGISKEAGVCAKKLKLSSRNKNLINLISQHFLTLSEIESAGQKEQFDFVSCVDFFRRPNVLYSCLLITQHILDLKKQKHTLGGFVSKIKAFEQTLAESKLEVNLDLKGKELGSDIKSKRFKIFQQTN
ncbi:MAG: hypothetical protein ISQ47_00405 [Methylophilaceae bacterium]|nr:hypothetical protein [Methylophilaceae bacterium]